MILVKIALLGDGAVGKTALRDRFMGKGFAGQYIQTIGAEFQAKETMVDKKPIKFQIWDLSGQPRFDAVREMFYSGALGALVIFDLTRPDSYLNLISWIDELWLNNNKQKRPNPIPFVLLGNKKDLPRKIPGEYGQKYADQVNKTTLPLGFEIPYMETSAKTGENVELAFQSLGKNILNFLTKDENNPLHRVFKG